MNHHARFLPLCWYFVYPWSFFVSREGFCLTCLDYHVLFINSLQKQWRDWHFWNIFKQLVSCFQRNVLKNKLHIELQAIGSQIFSFFLGEHATPRLRHQQEMPYTKAFLQETRRFRSVVPLAPSHKTTRDVTLNGFFIPKNTEVSRWCLCWILGIGTREKLL